eukprot:4389524-Pyramimonas_sp.AAC.1
MQGTRQAGLGGIREASNVCHGLLHIDCTIPTEPDFVPQRLHQTSYTIQISRHRLHHIDCTAYMLPHALHTMYTAPH